MAQKKAVAGSTTKKTSANKSSVKKKTVSKTVTTPKVVEKQIAPKNYLYAFLILVGGILLTLYIFEWYNVKKEERLSTSYLISSNTIESSVTDLNSLEQVRQETPSDYFIYLSYTGDENVYNLEKNLKKIIDNYKLNDTFYLVDLTELKEKDNDYLKTIANSIGIEKLNNLPAIIYVRDGKIVSTLDGINEVKLSADHFQKLLESYEFEAIN